MEHWSGFYPAKPKMLVRALAVADELKKVGQDGSLVAVIRMADEAA